MRSTQHSLQPSRVWTTWLHRTIAGYFVVAGVAVVAIWIGYFTDETAATRPFEPATEIHGLVGRSVAAGLTVALLSASLLGRRSDTHLAWGSAMVGAGMAGYAALNTLGETLAAGSAWTTLVAAALLASVVVAARLGPDGDLSPGWRSFLLAGLVVFAGWMLVRWLGAPPGPAARHHVTGFPITHYLAEAAMAGVTAVGSFGWLRDREWGRRLALFGMGTYLYSTLNALDWALANDPYLLPLLGLTTAAALAGAAVLTTRPGEKPSIVPHHDEETEPRESEPFPPHWP